MDLLNNVQYTVKKYSMLSAGDHVLIGLSGGPDSTCLAVILHNMRDAFDLRLSAVYIDHGLRPEETGAELSFCRELCEELSIDFITRSAEVKKAADDTGANMQETARDLRYEIYERVARELKACKIALGHNADDQAETVMMRLLRGAGRKGLSGIPPVRGNVIRPLIDTGRKDIEAYLTGTAHTSPLRSGQPYIVDTSNLRTDYFRNWLRLTVMEEIKKKIPSVAQDISRTAEILREEDAYLEQMVTKTLMRLISRKGEGRIELFLNPLETLEKPILRRVLRRALDATGGLRGISFVHIEDIIRLVSDGKAGDRIHLPKGIRAIREYSLLIITTEAAVRIRRYGMQPPCEVTIGEADITLRADIEDEAGDSAGGSTEVVLDADRVSFPLTVRSRVDGDFFYPLGFGKKKKLQDFFVDEKVPRDKRDSIPLVLSKNDIIWVAGYRADERFRVTERTARVLRLRITKR
jgi:tRNA(Ile)-lysidine synthase